MGDKEEREKMLESLAELTRMCGGQPFIKILLTEDGPSLSTNIPEKENVLGAMAMTLIHYKLIWSATQTIN